MAVAVARAAVVTPAVFKRGWRWECGAVAGSSHGSCSRAGGTVMSVHDATIVLVGVCVQHRCAVSFTVCCAYCAAALMPLALSLPAPSRMSCCWGRAGEDAGTLSSGDATRAHELQSAIQVCHQLSHVQWGNTVEMNTRAIHTHRATDRESESEAHTHTHTHSSAGSTQEDAHTRLRCVQ